MAIQIYKNQLHESKYVDETNGWLKTNSDRVIQVSIYSTDFGSVIVILYDDSDPVPEPLVTRRIRNLCP